MRGTLRPHGRVTKHLAAFMIVAAGWAVGVSAQSNDALYPTPVLSGEIDGRIAPRDLGDARLTRHFYAFNGVEGDLVLTVESTNLNGDVDLFIAAGLRPLVKVTLYAGSSATRASKSIYLRKEESLVLRVEARSAGDLEGAYRIQLSGAFAPASGARAAAPAPATPTLPDTARRDRNVRRATAAGALIDEPVTEPEPAARSESDDATSTASTAEPAARETDSRREAATPSEPAGGRPRPNRGARSSRRNRERTNRPAAETPRTETAGAEEKPADTAEAASEEAPRPARPPRSARN
ncbi:MAG: hypothetical protein ACRD68_15065, partial [Pyrinomonadaceae bacterium]